MFDEEQRGEHDQCRAEIHRLEQALADAIERAESLERAAKTSAKTAGRLTLMVEKQNKAITAANDRIGYWKARAAEHQRALNGANELAAAYLSDMQLLHSAEDFSAVQAANERSAAFENRMRLAHDILDGEGRLVLSDGLIAANDQIKELEKSGAELLAERDKWVQLAYDVTEALRGPASHGLLDVAKSRMATIDQLRGDLSRLKKIRHRLALRVASEHKEVWKRWEQVMERNKTISDLKIELTKADRWSGKAHRFAREAQEAKDRIDRVAAVLVLACNPSQRDPADDRNTFAAGVNDALAILQEEKDTAKPTTRELLDGKPTIVVCIECGRYTWSPSVDDLAIRGWYDDTKEHVSCPVHGVEPATGFVGFAVTDLAAFEESLASWVAANVPWTGPHPPRLPVGDLFEVCAFDQPTSLLSLETSSTAPPEPATRKAYELLLGDTDHSAWHSDRCYHRSGAHRDEQLCTCGLTAALATLRAAWEGKQGEQQPTLDVDVDADLPPVTFLGFAHPDKNEEP